MPRPSPGPAGPRRAPRSCARTRVVNLVNLEQVVQGLPRARAARPGLAGRRRGRADRRRRPQRRGQDDAAGGAGRQSRPGLGPGDPGAATSPSATCRRPTSSPGTVGQVGRSARCPSTSGPPTRAAGRSSRRCSAASTSARRSRQLSGGERRRAALAALLLRSYDLLLLDEPTNHLDIEAVSWLAGYLREFAGHLVVVTHDRWFLDAVTEETWEVADGQCTAYDGGYSAYVLARAERDRIAAAIDTRPPQPAAQGAGLAAARAAGPDQQAEVPDRRGHRADRGRAAAAGRRRAAPPGRRPARQDRRSTSRTSRPRRPGDRVLLTDVTWQLGPGDRVGVVGVNGTGKTTLLRLLAGTLPVPGERPGPTTGHVVHGSDGAAGLPDPGAGRRSIRTCACWRRPSRSAARPDRQARAVRQPAARPARPAGRPAVDAGRRPVRRRAAPAAADAACCWPSRTCCCSTSPPTTSTSTR